MSGVWEVLGCFIYMMGVLDWSGRCVGLPVLFYLVLFDSVILDPILTVYNFPCLGMGMGMGMENCN